MLMLAFFRWWYGPGWALLRKNVRLRLEHFLELFSVSILMRTLFSPWKRIISNPGAGLEAHLRAMLDNLVSRAVGLVIRIIVLISAGISFIVLGGLGLIQLIAWPLLPLAAIGLIIWGLI